MPYGVYQRRNRSNATQAQINYWDSMKGKIGNGRENLFKEGHTLTKSRVENGEVVGFKKGYTPWNKDLKGWNSEEKHVEWKGDKAGNSAMHCWVVRQKGRPKKCEDCGLDDPNRKYEWSNVDHKYKRKLEDYRRRCVPCHCKYDREMRLKNKNNGNHH